MSTSVSFDNPEAMPKQRTSIDPSYIRSPDELYARLAVHEAGHAVIGERTGFQVDFIELHKAEDRPSRSDSPGGVLAGSTSFVSPSGDINDLSLNRPSEFALVLLAGAAAEEYEFGSHLSQVWSLDLTTLRAGHGWSDPGSRVDSETQQRVRTTLAYWDEADRLVEKYIDDIRLIASAIKPSQRLMGNDVRGLLAL